MLWRKIAAVAGEGTIRQDYEPTGDEFEAFRDESLELIATDDVLVLRTAALRLLYALALADDRIAALEGRRRRDVGQKKRAGQKSAISRRAAVDGLMQAIEARRARSPHLSEAAAIIAELKRSDPAWHAGTDIERDHKVGALARRLRRARKKYRT